MAGQIAKRHQVSEFTAIYRPSLNLSSLQSFSIPPKIRHFKRCIGLKILRHDPICCRLLFLYYILW